MEEEIKKAIEILRRGGIILYPTDTVWGIGCDATNYSAIEKIYALKQRKDKNSMLVLTDSPQNVTNYVSRMPYAAEQLLEVADKPLTLILDNGCGVAVNLLPEDGTIGIRAVKHEFCQRLIRALHKPMVSTSANISGEATPKSFEAISAEIKNGVDMIISTRFEGNPTRKPSSIIKVSNDNEIKVIRS
jgi:L-threonylcarbamoyladenylate synthase